MTDNTEKPTRTLYTSEYLKGAAKRLSEDASSNTRAQDLLDAMMSSVATAFFLEASLSRIGSHALPFWDQLERKLSTDEKLNVLCKHLGMVLDRNTRPAQTLHELMWLRNTLAHGKVLTSTVRASWSKSGDSINLQNDKTPHWDFSLNKDRARVYFEDVCD